MKHIIMVNGKPIEQLTDEERRQLDNFIVKRLEETGLVKKSKVKELSK